MAVDPGLVIGGDTRKHPIETSRPSLCQENESGEPHLHRRIGKVIENPRLVDAAYLAMVFCRQAFNEQVEVPQSCIAVVVDRQCPGLEM